MSLFQMHCFKNQFFPILQKIIHWVCAYGPGCEVQRGVHLIRAGPPRVAPRGDWNLYDLPLDTNLHGQRCYTSCIRHESSHAFVSEVWVQTRRVHIGLL